MSEPKVENYLRALGLACIEAASKPRVRALLVMLLLRAPRTLCELARTERRAARRIAA